VSGIRAPALSACRTDVGVLGTCCCAPPLNSPWRIELGALWREPEEITASMNARNRNTPPPIQLSFVSRVAACRPPMKESVEEEAPPKVAASPPPLPDWSKMMTHRRTASRMRTMSRNVYSIESCASVTAAKRAKARARRARAFLSRLET